MALSDEDLEKIGKLLERVVDLRIALSEQRTNETIVAVVQEIQAVEKRLVARFDKLEARFDKLEARFDKLEARVENLEKRADVQEREMAALKALVVEVQQTVKRIYNEHGGALAQLQDGLTMLYRRQNMLEQRADYLDLMFKQRFSAPPTP